MSTVQEVLISMLHSFTSEVNTMTYLVGQIHFVDTVIPELIPRNLINFSYVVHFDNHKLMNANNLNAVIISVVSEVGLSSVKCW